jgi:hypothetical protein
MQGGRARPTSVEAPTRAGRQQEAHALCVCATADRHPWIGQALAVTKGKVADIVASRGQLDEALRILEHDVAPAFERLGSLSTRSTSIGGRSWHVPITSRFAVGRAQEGSSSRRPCVTALACV